MRLKSLSLLIFFKNIFKIFIKYWAIKMALRTFVAQHISTWAGTRSEKMNVGIHWKSEWGREGERLGVHGGGSRRCEHMWEKGVTSAGYTVCPGCGASSTYFLLKCEVTSVLLRADGSAKSLATVSFILISFSKWFSIHANINYRELWRTLFKFKQFLL